MDVKVENDGKGEYQSFTASTHFTVSGPGAGGHYFAGVQIRAWGADEAEAIENLKAAAKHLQDALSE